MDETTERDELDGSKAPFLEHLEELRRRVWYAMIAVVITSIGCWVYREFFFDLVTRPLYTILKGADETAAMKFRTVAGAFMFQFKTTILGGVFLAMPVLLYQVWRFVSPGLYASERKMAMPFMILASICFYCGVTFAYTIALPVTFEFLMSYEIGIGSFTLEPDITSEDYFGLFTQGLLVFGILFLMPVILGFLAAAGILTYKDLLKFWRWSVVISFILGAFLSPPDPLTQFIYAFPMIALYGLSILVAYLVAKKDDEDTEGETDVA